jgi:dolichyl-phosphate mannosyltransferase polypeptide 3
MYSTTNVGGSNLIAYLRTSIVMDDLVGCCGVGLQAVVTDDSWSNKLNGSFFYRSPAGQRTGDRQHPMKRFQVAVAALLACVGVWLRLKMLYAGRDASPLAQWLVDVCPWYVLIVFGCYCLTKLGYDLLTFNDYPAEIALLERDIQAAEADLKRRGFVAS